MITLHYYGNFFCIIFNGLQFFYNTIYILFNGNFVNKDADYTSNIQYVLWLSKTLNPTTQITVEGFYKDYKNYAVSIEDGVSLANKGGGFEVLGNEEVITNGLERTDGMEFLYQQKLTNNFFGIFA